MKIEDNFLGQKEFDKIEKITTRSILPWFYADGIDSPDDVDKFQFFHIFYEQSAPQSPFMIELGPILELIQPLTLLKIKANLLTRTPNIVENTFHIDIGELSEEKQEQWTTSIFYVNTNNGYTEFEDDTKVESVANRLVSFPANMKHRGSSCTDERTRIVINFNYFK